MRKSILSEADAFRPVAFASTAIPVAVDGVAGVTVFRIFRPIRIEESWYCAWSVASPNGRERASGIRRGGDSLDCVLGCLIELFVRVAEAMRADVTSGRWPEASMDAHPLPHNGAARPVHSRGASIDELFCFTEVMCEYRGHPVSHNLYIYRPTYRLDRWTCKWVIRYHSGQRIKHGVEVGVNSLESLRLAMLALDSHVVNLRQRSLVEWMGRRDGYFCLDDVVVQSGPVPGT